MYRFVLFAALLNVHAGLQWTGHLPDQAVVTTCVGSDVHLPWNFTLSPGERIVDIKWIYQANHRADELIAVFVTGFFNPMPAFSGRVHMTGEGGIVISKAAFAESGNYSVVISIDDAANPLVIYQRTANVKVVDSPRTESMLHVQQSGGAVYDNSTGQWRVQLACGVFSDFGHPAVDVVWTTPDGQQLQSFSVHNGTFYLLLPNPPSGGNYTCTLPPLSPAVHCLPPLSPLLEGATVYVDEVRSSFLLLAAKQEEIQTQMKAENSELKNENEYLKHEIIALRNKTESLQAWQNDKGTKPQNISFHARLGSDLHNFIGRLQPFTVISNEGNAFDGSTGLFTAPVSGLYFFIGSAGTLGAGNWIYVDLMKSGTAVSRALAKVDSGHYTMGSCHAALHLTVGEQVWLNSVTNPDHDYSAESTHFSGMLISSYD